MLHIPILRHGMPYESIDKIEIVHHATGEPVAAVSQANPGLISRDVHRWDHDVLDQFTVCSALDPWPVEVLYPKNHLPPIAAGEQPVDEKRASVSQVECSGRRGGQARDAHESEFMMPSRAQINRKGMKAPRWPWRKLVL